jgi:hypothetical protein
MQEIWSCRVNPQLDTLYSSGVNFMITPSPLSFATMPFHYWRGSITFRFEIVCSSLHRGKIGVFAEPNSNHKALINADISTNKQLLALVDIQQTQNFSVTVNYASDQPWLKTEEYNLTARNYRSFLASPSKANGYITVFCFTGLQSPDSSDVAINVYAHSDDMQVNLFGKPIFDERWEPESDSRSLCNHEPTNFQFFDRAPDTYAATHTFGERPVSFRTLTKRFATSESLTIGDPGSNTNNLSVVAPIIPLPYAQYGAGASAVTYSAISYLRYAFLAVRGTVRKRMHPKFTAHADSTTFRSVVHLSVPAVAAPITSIGWTSALTLRPIGSVSFKQHTNAGIEVELPHYAPTYFAFSSNDDLIDSGNASINNEWVKTFVFQMEVCANGSADNTVVIDSAAGEDFTMFCFLGSPSYTY